MSSGGTHREKRILRQLVEHLNHRRHSEVIVCCQRLLDYNAQQGDAFFYWGIAEGELGNHFKAVEKLQHALHIKPNNSNVLGQLSRYLYNTGHYSEAETSANQALQLNPTNAQTLDTLGCVFTYLEQHQKALQCFDNAVKIAPNDFMNHYNKANTLQFLGQFTQAEHVLAQVLKLNPHFSKAWWSLAQISKADSSTALLTQLNDELQKAAGHNDAETYLHFALGKVLEDRGDYQPAFYHYQQGCSARRATASYHLKNDQQLYQHIKNTFSTSALSHVQTGCSSDEAIFIVGLPRTGTTLVDRIVASHSQVESAGELRNFRTVLKKLLLQSGTLKANNLIDIPEIDVVHNALSVDLRQLGEDYITSTRYVTGNKPYFIDKLPQNYLYLGLICMALPKAKIIHLTRNPMDTCFSNFKQLFSKGCYYSYDLADMAHNFLLYQDLMHHWEKMFPEQILTVNYENLVTNQETQTRRMLAFCALDWETACLDFHKNPSSVATASAHQVRQPLYTHSLEKWRHFEHSLSTLQKILTLPK